MTATPTYVERLLASRREASAKLIRSTDHGAVWRASWHEVGMVGGSGGGWTRDHEIVKWVAVDSEGRFLGAWNFRRFALEEVGAR